MRALNGGLALGGSVELAESEPRGADELSTSARVVALVALAGGVFVAQLGGQFLWLGLSVCAIALGGWILKDPLSTWIVFAGSLGFSGVRLQAGLVVVLPEHVGLLVALAHVCLRPRKRLINSSYSAPWVPVCVAFIWLGFACVVSFGWAPDVGQSVRLIGWTALSLFGFIVAVIFPLSVQTKARLLLAGAAAHGLVALIGFVSANLGMGLIGLVEADYASSTFRAEGFAQEPNILASFLVAALICAWVVRVPRTLSVRSQELVIILAIVATYTRASVAILLVLGGLALARSASRRPLLLLAGLGTLLPLAYYILDRTLGVTVVIAERLQRLTDTTGGTGLYRSRAVDLAIAQLSREGAWLGGLGFNTFPQRNEAPAFAGGGEQYLGVFPVTVLYDTGIVGAILVSAVFVGLSFYLRSLWGWRGQFLVAALLLTSLATNPFWFIFPWLAMGLCAGAGRHAADRGPCATSLKQDSLERGGTHASAV